MKILCLSTLDKFSRFYLDIEKQLAIKSNYAIDLKIYSLYFSGFFYAFVRCKFSSWISLKAWFLVRRRKAEYSRTINETKIYKDLDYDNYLKFHLGLDKNISKKSLQLQALAYIDIFDKILNTQQPDYIISIGDSRMCIEIALALAKQKSIKIYYIEQGPFQTTFFDETGVNANLSIRHKLEVISSKETKEKQINLKQKSKNYKRSPIYRGIDMLLMNIFERSNLYPPDLKFTDLNTFRFKRSKVKNTIANNTSHTKTILLALQVPLDVNMIYHSPIFKSHTDILTSIFNNLPKNTQLIIREHPLFINKYEKSFYAFVDKHQIKIDNSTPLHQAINASHVVIVNNSTVGIEAILNYKPVVVLGNSFYDNSNICLKLYDENALGNLLEKALNHTPNKQHIDNFKHLLFNTVLLKGTITDKDLQSSQDIANHILAHH